MCSSKHCEAPVPCTHMFMHRDRRTHTCTCTLTLNRTGASSRVPRLRGSHHYSPSSYSKSKPGLQSCLLFPFPLQRVDCQLLLMLQRKCTPHTHTSVPSPGCESNSDFCPLSSRALSSHQPHLEPFQHTLFTVAKRRIWNTNLTLSLFPLEHFKGFPMSLG